MGDKLKQTLSSITGLDVSTEKVSLEQDRQRHDDPRVLQGLNLAGDIAPYYVVQLFRKCDLGLATVNTDDDDHLETTMVPNE